MYTRNIIRDVTIIAENITSLIEHFETSEPLSRVAGVCVSTRDMA